MKPNRLSLFALFLAAPLAAQDEMPAPEQDYAAMTTAQIGNEIGAIADDASHCAVAYPLFSEAARRRPDLDVIAEARDRSEIACLYDLDRFREALNRVEAFEQGGGELGAQFGLLIATLAEDGPATLKRFEGYLGRGNAEQLAELDPEVAWAAMRAARKDGLDAQVDGILARAVRAGALERINPQLHSSFASGALDIAVAEKDTAFASELLKHIDNPTSYARLLGLRRFEPIWPAIETRVGPNYRAVTSAYRVASTEAWAEQPGDLGNLNEAAHALYFDSDFEGAIALVDLATARDDLLETIDEDEAWALNIKAYALDALGRTAEADAVFDRLASLDPEEHGWLVSFVINRASRLVGQGRWEEGLAAAALAQRVAGEQGNIYAKMLVARDHIAALTALDRSPEIAPHLAYIEENKMESPGLAAAALQAAGREQAAVDLLLAALADETLREEVIEDLQSEAFDLFYTRTILPQPRDLVAGYPALRDAFLEYARFIPESFHPAASLKR